MTQDRFRDLLKDAIGLDANSIGVPAIMRAVERRARACHLGNLEDYWDVLSNNSSERQALIETVIVPETWFYRDREAFTVAARILREAWQASPTAPPLRVLSAPCSTGEEPYTIAMALLDASVPSSAIRIEGIDVSNGSLECARAGIYGRNSFRGTDLAYRHHHFTQTVEKYHISDAVRSMVHFSQGNLFELDHLADGTFDVIFCRNLLIYFDAADQRRAAGVLHRLLAPAGKLFVGHSEASVLLREGFSSLRIPQAFAFHKSHGDKVRPSTEVANRLPTQSQRHPTPPQPQRARPFAKPLARHLPPTKVPIAQSPTLEDIRRAADRGELGLALQLGRAMIDDGQPSTEAFYLLAVISEAAGANDSAADYYRRTLYLDPNHHEALTHLTLMLHRTGDSDGAKRIEDRARRLDERRRPE